MTARRLLPSLAIAVALSACAAGAPAFGYRLPDRSPVTYEYGDTTIVSADMGGQRLEIGMRGAAEYGVAFARTDGGVEASLTVETLAATLTVPMGGSQQVDETEVEGPLVFLLDAEGNATVTRTPRVSMTASRMISSVTTAHTFFPGLPNRVVAPGDRWVDTIAYEGNGELGNTTEHTVLEYTLVGDTTVAGRLLERITFSGTTSTTNTMDMGGMDVTQESTLSVEGRVLWDRDAALMYEMIRTGTGRGTARVPMVPLPIPIRLTTTQRAHLRGM